MVQIPLYYGTNTNQNRKDRRSGRTEGLDKVEKGERRKGFEVLEYFSVCRMN